MNVVQSSFPDAQQGEISGLSRSVSNLGSSLGTAVAGTILVAELVDWSYGLAMTALAVTGSSGWSPPCSSPRTPPRALPASGSYADVTSATAIPVEPGPARG